MKLESSPLPDAWGLEFVRKADLNASFDALSGRDHFFAETMRGRIRSLQLRFDEAWEHFDLASENASFAEPTISNLARQFVSNCYILEHSLLESPLGQVSSQIPSHCMSDFPEEALTRYPFLRTVDVLRRFSDARLELHLGHWERTKSIYQGLLSNVRMLSPNCLALAYLNLAVVEFNLGAEGEGRRQLENAAFAVQAGTDVLNRGQFAALLYVMHRSLGDRQDALSWDAFLRRLDCVKATRDALLVRAELVLSQTLP